MARRETPRRSSSAKPRPESHGQRRHEVAQVGVQRAMVRVGHQEPEGEVPDDLTQEHPARHVRGGVGKADSEGDQDREEPREDQRAEAHLERLRAVDPEERVGEAAVGEEVLPTIGDRMGARKRHRTRFFRAGRGHLAGHREGVGAEREVAGVEETAQRRGDEDRDQSVKKNRGRRGLSRGPRRSQLIQATTPIASPASAAYGAPSTLVPAASPAPAAARAADEQPRGGRPLGASASSHHSVPPIRGRSGFRRGARRRAAGRRIARRGSGPRSEWRRRQTRPVARNGRAEPPCERAGGQGDEQRRRGTPTARRRARCATAPSTTTSTANRRPARRRSSWRESARAAAAGRRCGANSS